MKTHLKILKSTLVLAWLVTASTPTWAQEEENGLAEAHKIVDRMVEAMGGEDSMRKITSRVMKASMEMAAQGITINLVATQKAPNKVLVEQEIPGLMTGKQGFDGTTGWANDSIQGLRKLEGGELDELKKDADILRELNLKEDYPKMEVLPEVEEGDKKFQVIKAEDKDGETETWFFDKETGLLAKSHESINMEGAGKLDVEMTISDYREVDGVKMPHQIDVTNPAFSFEITVSEYKQNVDVDDAIFAMPDEDEEAAEDENAEEADFD